MELYKKLDQFTDYWFDEASHSYTYKGLKVKISVTQLINTYIKPFESDYWLEKKSKKLGITIDELAAEWKKKSDISTTSGTLFHEFMESSLAGKRYAPTEHIPSNVDYMQQVKEDLELLVPLGKQFIEDTRHKLIPVRSELTVGLSNLVAGQIDQLFYNPTAQKLEVWDWKTNKDIRIKSPYREHLLKELFRYDASEFYEYSLQLNIYKQILARCGIETGDCYFVWFNKSKKVYTCYKCENMSQEADHLLSKLVD